MFLSVALTASCGGTQAEEYRQAAEAEVQTFVNTLVDIQLRGAWDEWLTHYVAPSEMTVARDGTFFANGDEYFSTYRQVTSQVDSVTNFNWLQRRVYVLGPEAAVFNGLYTQELYMNGGGPQSLQGAWTALLTKTNGVWRIAAEHSSHAR
jgi:ketosteroid isomerase-like protein